MKTIPFSSRTERIAEQASSLGDKWAGFQAETYSSGQLESRTKVRTTKAPDLFLDIEISEYTGVSRRLKFTSVRLGEDATRLLYEALRAKFDFKGE